MNSGYFVYQHSIQTAFQDSFAHMLLVKSVPRICLDQIDKIVVILSAVAAVA